MTTANDILTLARHYLGSTEGGSNHRYIIDTYNKTKPLPRGYTVKYTDDWCATFVSFVGIEAGVPDLYGRECGVERFIEIFKAKNIWLEDGSITPKPGDIICYNWDDGTQPNDGFADHIGFVESVSGGTITTIEGNYGDSVRRRTISIGAGNIRGYARPSYTDGIVNGWRNDNSQWQFYESGAKVKNVWRQIGGRWYYFNGVGDMTTGWLSKGGVWYYLDRSGAMQTGWQIIDGRYYKLRSDGAMLEGWYKEGKTWYYLNANGSLKTGWFKDNGGHWYYLASPSGAMVTGTVPIDGKTYQFNASGVCLNP